MLFENQRQLLGAFDFTTEECSKILSALRQRHVPRLPGDAQQRALRFITTSRPVEIFLEQEVDDLNRLFSDGGYERRVVVGDFGAGKTHIKTYLLNHIRDERYGLDIAPILIDVPRTGQGFDFYRSLLLFQRAAGEAKGYRTVYPDVIRRLQDQVTRELREKHWTLFTSCAREWWLGESVVKERVLAELRGHGFSEQFSSAIVNLAEGVEGGHDKFLSVLERELTRGTGGEDLFVLVRKLLARVGYKGLVILIDEFGRLEHNAWTGMSESFAEEIASFHNSLESLVSDDTTFAVYMALFTPGSYWIGQVRPPKSGRESPETRGLQSQANARALFERLSGSEFRIPDLTLAEVERLTAKVVALYQASGLELKKNPSSDISRLAGTVYHKLKEEDSSISARWVLDGVLRGLDSLIINKKGR